MIVIPVESGPASKMRFERFTELSSTSRRLDLVRRCKRKFDVFPSVHFCLCELFCSLRAL